MRTFLFDVDIIPNEDSLAVVFNVPTSASWRAVERLVAALLYAFAVAEEKPLEEMEAQLCTMMTLTPVPSGTEIKLKRPHSDPSYFVRFDEALNRKTLQRH